jgi:hypothetical protein
MSKRRFLKKARKNFGHVPPGGVGAVGKSPAGAIVKNLA